MSLDNNAINRIKLMVEKYTSKGPYHLHPDKDKVRSIICDCALFVSDDYLNTHTGENNIL